MLTATSALWASHKACPVRVLSIKSDIFYFKVDKIFLGATVEVYAQNGEIIFTEKVTNRKTIVDFYFEDPGTYTIRLKKDGKEEHFTYHKMNPSPHVNSEIESVTGGGSMKKE